MVLIEHKWHFEESQTEFSDDYTERYYLTAVHENTNSENILIAFLMNPSHAGKSENKEKFDQSISDKTVNLLLRTIGKSYGQVIVINNIPLIESNSSNIKYINYDSLKYNTKKIKSIIQDKLYDLYVGVGSVGYDGNNSIRASFTRNMNILSDCTHCINIFISGLNDGGSPKHPKVQGQGDDVSALLLNLRRKVSWNGQEFYYLKAKAEGNTVQTSFITRKKLLINQAQ